MANGKEIGIIVGAVLSVLEHVVKRGEILEPPLDSGVVASIFFNVFQSLVIRINAKIYALKVASQVLDCRNGGTRFLIERSLIFF